MSNINFPNVIIGGAPKCGTSSLFFWLTAHPEVCGSRVKETYFLTDGVSKHNANANFITHGLNKYSELFPDYKGEKIIVEATAPYIYMNTPLEVLPTLPKKPKVIFILREPSARIYSHFRFNKYRMKNLPIGYSFKDYVEAEGGYGNMSDYVEDTIYVNYISKWVDALGIENVKVFQFEEIVSDKKNLMKRVASEIGIDQNFYNSFDFFKRNETVAVKRKWLHTLGLKIEPFVPQKLQEKIFIPLYLKFNSGAIPKTSEEEKQIKNELKIKFKKRNVELKKLFPNINLQLWE